MRLIHSIQTTYLDLSQLTPDQIRQIPEICDAFSLPIVETYRKLFLQGAYYEKMPLMFWWKQFGKLSCTYIRHFDKTEITFPEFVGRITEPESPGSKYQPLFDHLSEAHGLTLLESELSEIIRIVHDLKG